MREMDEEHRRQYEEELKKQQVKHNKHDKIHHPGNKAQLEEGNVEHFGFVEFFFSLIKQSFFLSSSMGETRSYGC